MKLPTNHKSFKTFMQGSNHESALKQLYAKRKGVIGIKPIKNPLVPAFTIMGEDKKAIKPIAKKKGQSNIENMIDSLAGQPTGVPSGIPTGNHV